MSRSISEIIQRVGKIVEEITKIINDWDPIGFFPMAPKDEYANEITKIYDYVYSSRNLQIRTLAEAINKIFVETFGADVYDENLEQCLLVAEKILVDSHSRRE